MTHRSDEEVIGKALAGSSGAGGELFRRYWSSSWRAAFAVVGRRAAADDIAQDAFQRAFGALSSFDPRRPFGPWLHRIVVNCALDFVRSERRLVAVDPAHLEGVEAHDERLPDHELLAALA